MGNYNVNELLKKALKETDNLYEKEIFLLKDLFAGYEWQRISRGDRILLGTIFLNEINNSANNINVIPIEKTTSNQQKYMKQ